MTLTVRQLTEIPYLGTRIHAGAAGADGAIAWAHSIEMSAPWEWLEEGDLLMTVGLGIPREPAEQVRYVEELAAVGASGIAIGEDMQAPPLSAAMIDAVERLGLPLLLTAYAVPFVQISRTVGTASRDYEHGRSVRAVRIYDRVRADLARGSLPGELLPGLAEELRCHIWVCANDTGAGLLPRSATPTLDVQQAFVTAVRARCGLLPGIVRLAVGSATVHVVPVPAHRPASLLAVPLTEAQAPPYALLQHAATVVALELERIWAGREERRRLGSETLGSLLDGRMSGTTGAWQAKSHDLTDGPYVLVAAEQEGGWDGRSWLHHAMAEREIPNMLLRRGETLYGLLPAGETLEGALEILKAAGARVGVSDAFGDLDGVRGAVREARWALVDALASDGLVARYGEEHRSVGGPRSLAEAQGTVDRVLGPVLAYDREHGTDLVTSLEAFLAVNRSWQRAAATLFIHKQTLVYRMQRVEQLTGRKLNETCGVAELWLALQALHLVAV